MIDKSHPFVGIPMNIFDIYEDYEHLFNAKAKQVYSKDKINKTDPNTRYFCTIAVGKGAITKAAAPLIEIINELADKDYISHFMSYFGCMTLGIGTPRIDYAVYIWPVLTPEGCAYVYSQNYDFNMPEGGLPKTRFKE